MREPGTEAFPALSCVPTKRYVNLLDNRVEMCHDIGMRTSHQHRGADQMSTEFTNSDYERTHGKSPRGEGGWAFQRSSARTAFSRERYGEVEFFYGTLTVARKQAKQTMSDSSFVAVLG